MTIGNPIRLDRLQRALVHLFGSAGGLTDYQVAWAYGQGVYTSTFPRGFVNLTMASGPNIAAPPGRGVSLYPIASIAWTVDTVFDGALVAVYINGLPYRVNVGPLDTVDTVRDALVAAINADASGEYTATAGLAAGAWTLTATSLGSVWQVRKVGALSAVVTNATSQALVTQARANVGVTVECYSKDTSPMTGAWSMAVKLSQLLLLPEAAQVLADHGLGFTGSTPLLDLSAVAGGKWESRVAFTSSINILSSVSRPIGSIDTVDLSSGFSSPVLASNVEVTAP